MSALPRQRTVSVGAWTRRWWALWCSRAQRGIDVRPMSHAARTGKPWLVPADVMVSDIGFVALPVDAPEVDEWARHFAKHGAALPRPSRVPAIYMPAMRPPDVGGGGSDLKGVSSRTGVVPAYAATPVSGRGDVE